MLKLHAEKFNFNQFVVYQIINKSEKFLFINTLLQSAPLYLDRWILSEASREMSLIKLFGVF